MATTVVIEYASVQLRRESYKRGHESVVCSRVSQIRGTDVRFVIVLTQSEIALVKAFRESIE